MIDKNITTDNKLLKLSMVKNITKSGKDSADKRNDTLDRIKGRII